jgi:hypothetical protein
MLMTIEEIVNKAIPITFHGVKCSATLRIETNKALLRREQLTKEIATLLQTAKDGDRSNVCDGVGRPEAY